MNRRDYLKAVAVGASALGTAPAGRAAAKNPIQLHVDLDVDPAREKEMLGNFRDVFQPQGHPVLVQMATQSEDAAIDRCAAVCKFQPNT